MLQLLENFKKGRTILIGKNKAVVTSGLMKFKEFYAIYADIIENIDFNMGCGTYKINDKLALIIRDKERLLDIRINSRRKKSYILSRTRTLF